MVSALLSRALTMAGHRQEVRNGGDVKPKIWGPTFPRVAFNLGRRLLPGAPQERMGSEWYQRGSPGTTFVRPSSLVVHWHQRLRAAVEELSPALSRKLEVNLDPDDRGVARTRVSCGTLDRAKGPEVPYVSICKSQPCSLVIKLAGSGKARAEFGFGDECLVVPGKARLAPVLKTTRPDLHHLSWTVNPVLKELESAVADLRKHYLLGGAPKQFMVDWRDEERGLLACGDVTSRKEPDSWIPAMEAQATGGDARAMYGLSLLGPKQAKYLKSPQTSCQYLEAASSMGLAYASYVLARSYAWGNSNNIPQNWSKAEHYMKCAANQGSRQALKWFDACGSFRQLSSDELYGPSSW